VLAVRQVFLDTRSAAEQVRRHEQEPRGARPVTIARRRRAASGEVRSSCPPWW
jgi:hypothetical protein